MMHGQKNIKLRIYCLMFYDSSQTHLNIGYILILCRCSIFGLYAFSDVCKLQSMYIVTPVVTENVT